MSFKNFFSNRKTSSSKVTYLNKEYQNLNDRAYHTQNNSFNIPFWRCYQPVLIVAQWTGLMPISCNSNGTFQMNWKSVKFLYSVVVGLVILALSIVTLMKALHDDMEFEKIIQFIFYFVDFLVVLQFQVLCLQWSNIMVVWNDFEKTLDQNEQLLGKRFSLKVLFQLILVVVSVMTIIVEILSVISGLEKGLMCPGINDELERYYKQAFPQVFLYTGYMLWKGLLLQVVQFLCTWYRMFLDVFLIFISIGLCRLIERVNLKYGLPRSYRTLTEEFWTRYKDQYQQFMYLVRFVDKRIGHIIVLCFLSDLYLICVRILNSLKSMDTVRQALFFWYALLFLILRFIFVCLCAANFHEEAKRPLKMLRKIPASCWCLEAQRFQDLITHNDVCLTGVGYFRLRRSLLLSISGTIVTYELVLMQFSDSGSLDSTNKNPCT